MAPTSITRRGSGAIRLVGLIFLLSVAMRAQGQGCVGYWLPEPSGPDAAVSSVTAWDPDGPGPLQSLIVAGGWFSHAGGTPANRAAVRGVNGQWSSMDTGVPAGGYPYRLAASPEGTLVSVMITGGPGGTVYRWNGSSWGLMGSSISAQNIAVAPNGYVLAAGSGASIAQEWNGFQWLTLGTSAGTAISIAGRPNGEVMCGLQSVSGWNVVRYQGPGWIPLGASFDGDVNALVVLPNGDIIAGGLFRAAGGINIGHGLARWNGTAWSSLAGGVDAAGLVWALAALPDGRVVAGGTFTSAGGVPAHNIAVWDGTTWAPLGGGVSGLVQGRGVYSIAVLPNGEVAVGGSFTTAGGSPSPYFARFAFVSSDFNRDGDSGTDADIEAFFACLAGNCCATCGNADFDGDGESGTGADIESFFRVLAGGSC